MRVVLPTLCRACCILAMVSLAVAATTDPVASASAPEDAPGSVGGGGGVEEDDASSADLVVVMALMHLEVTAAPPADCDWGMAGPTAVCIASCVNRDDLPIA